MQFNFAVGHSQLLFLANFGNLSVFYLLNISAPFHHIAQMLLSRDDSQRRFLAQHSVAILLRHYFE